MTLISHTKLESYIKASMIGVDRAMNASEIALMIYHAFDEVDRPNSPRVRHILESWEKRGFVYKVKIYGKNGYYWILSGEPFEVEE